MSRLAFAACLAAALGAADAASAEEWLLKRSTTSGSCWVAKATTAAPGVEIGRHPTRKAACEDASRRYEAATTDSSKCGTYAAGTVTECGRDGVKLPP